MGKKMLIDAAHREETRVAIVSGNRVENFDFESEAKRPLRGNIYLAKVTRVEPSLQAAFIEYGGNRHGFLAFSEIHPDYYQIPVADREKLLAEEAAERYEDEDDDDDAVDLDEDADASERDAFDIGANAFEDDVTDEDTTDDAEAASADDADDAALDSDEAGEDDNNDAPAIAASATPVETVSEVVDADEAEDGTEQDDTAAEDAGELPEAEIEEIEDDDTTEEVSASDDDDVIDAVDDDEAESAESDDDTSADDTSADAGSDDSDEDASEDTDGETKPRGRGRGRGRGRSNARNGGGRNSGGRNGSRGRGRSGSDGGERRSRRSRSRHYKIQEVIKRRQILLVQVVKEERGNKGAALTTYLSLAGRYCVLMPNTARGGGISRKITNTSDRRRLKEAMNEMDVSEGMGLIVRTAGANRTKVEIKRDFDYLLRLWESIRDLTLKSSAPCLIYEEGDLIKRSIRDQYSKDIDEIVVDGDKAYKEAKDFMRMLMPSHAKNVKRYKDREPLLQRYGVQGELDSLLEPTVTLKSGGYIVINPTEALVSIDVNSGKSTKEHNIEATAVSTNLEAAEEISRQLRLRDMAGLIVIDFIDMDEPRNNRAVERKLKDSLKQDRARIQVGRISSFGLLEMSRQRMRSGVLEGSTDVCPHCKGTGMIRSTESAALQVLRAIEAEALKGRTKALDVHVPTDVAVFILNQKRADLQDIERRGRVSIYLLADGSLISPDYSIKRTDARTPDVSTDTDALSMESAFDEEEEAALDAAAEAEAEALAREDTDAAEGTADAAEDKPKRRRRRRRRKTEGGASEDSASEDSGEATEEAQADDASQAADEASTGDENVDDTDGSDEDEDGKPRKRRRRGRRGGRRHRRNTSGTDEEGSDDAVADTGADAKSDDTSNEDAGGNDVTAASNAAADADEEAPILVAYSSSTSQPVVVEPGSAKTDPVPQSDVSESSPDMTDSAEEAVSEQNEDDVEAAPTPDSEPPSNEAASEPETPAPTKRGWWQRRLSS